MIPVRENSEVVILYPDVWNIYQQFTLKITQSCMEIYHTWIIWDIVNLCILLILVE